MKHRSGIRLGRLSAACAALAATATLSACGSSGGPELSVGSGSAPVALTPPGSGTTSVAMPVDEGELRKAIERHRITKKRRESPVEFAGADLNSDGKPEFFRSCSGFEGTHLTIWSGKSVSGERIWHSFYYVDYATVPDCKDAEWKYNEI